MANVIRIKKGLNINLSGSAKKESFSAGIAEYCNISPLDFHGFTPRLLVKAGDRVLAGTPLMSDKNYPEINCVAPVSGTVNEVVRGDKRKLLNIVIKPDTKIEYLDFETKTQDELSQEKIIELLQQSGLWLLIKQRPYDIYANPVKKPRSIFVTCFDSAPLAPDYDYLTKGNENEINAGLEIIRKLTDGKVYLGVPVGCTCQAIKKESANIEVRYFNGPHPAGNAGVQINNIEPVNKGEIVWTLNLPDLMLIGRFFLTGKVNLSKIVAITGPEVRNPRYVRCLPGYPVKALVEGNVYKEVPLRYINGNVLSGKKVDYEGSLDFYSYQLTVIREGQNIHEFIGWIMPRLNTFSFSRTYFSWIIQKIIPNITFTADTRILGGERALIMSGEYDRVFPMSVLPEQLVRACITGNYEKMEDLGIYEVAPEDFALCEFVCTSKIEVQKIIRQSLDSLKLENGD